MDVILTNKYGHALESQAKAIPNLSAQDFLKPMRLLLGDTKLTHPYKQHVWTYTCINAKATALKGVPFQIVRYKGQDKSTGRNIINSIRSAPLEKLYKKDSAYLKSNNFEQVEDGPVYELFNKPNPIMCRAQLWESYMILMTLTGEVFWVLDGGTHENGAVAPNELPKEIWPFGKDCFEPNLKDGSLVGWKRTAANGMPEKQFDISQLIRFYKFNPYEYLRGLAPFEVVQKPASQDLKAQIFNERFFENGAFLGGFLKIQDMLDPDKQKSLMATFNDKHQGAENAGKTGILAGGADFLWNPSTHNDMQYMDGRKWNRDESFAGLGVPKIKGSIYEDLQLATALQADKSFWNDQIIPEAHYIEDMINSRLFSGSIRETQGLYCLFDFSNVEALQTNNDSKSQIAERYYKMGWPINQINDRLGIGFEPVPWGDVAWMSASMVPIDENYADKEVVEPVPKPAEDKPAKIIRNIETKATTREKLTRLWIVRVFDTTEPQFKTKMERYWNRLRNEQIALFEQATKSLVKAVPSADELNSILFNNKEWQDKLKKTAVPYLNLAASYSLEDIADLLGTEIWETTDPRILSVLAEKEKKIVGITDRVWNKLKTSLSDGIKAGETITDLSNRIKTQFDIQSNNSLTQARTEIAQVASPVRHAVMVGEGVTKSDWSDSGDEHVRGDHIKLGASGTHKMDHNYMEDLGKSGTLMHPSDPSGPADQVINCRCVELPAN